MSTTIRLHRNSIVIVLTVCVGTLYILSAGFLSITNKTNHNDRPLNSIFHFAHQRSILSQGYFTDSEVLSNETAPIPLLSNLRKPQNRMDGKYKKIQILKGLVFTNKTEMGSMDGEIESEVILSVIKALSPGVEQHVKDMFNDDHNECVFHATIPAMVRRDNKIEVVQRIWLSQYEKMKTKYRRNEWNLERMVEEWKNTWQENHFYYMQLDENYNQLLPGQLMGIPTTTNVKFTYKSDGPMDPRLAKVGDDYFLVFHTWLVDKNSDDAVGGRTHIWDMDRHTKKKLWPHIKLQRTEINWIPLDIGGELYFTYSIDPLRVMKCEKSTGDCVFVYEQKGSTSHPFLWTNDHIRGGTPWVLYKYPYYISIGHSVAATYQPYQDFSIYNAHIVVISVEPWRVVYTSRPILADNAWLTSEPIIRNHTIKSEFFYPTGLVMWDDDTFDISCHLNDASGHILRLRGIADIMQNVMRQDSLNKANTEPDVRIIQQYILQSVNHIYQNWSFIGDIVNKVMEDPITGEITVGK